MPGLGVFALVMLLAMPAPLVLLTSVVLACAPRSRKTGLYLLFFSFNAALALTIGWLVLAALIPAMQGSGPAVIIFGAFFTLSFFSLAFWRFIQSARPSRPGGCAKSRAPLDAGIRLLETGPHDH